MESNHTPGPWRVEDFGYSDRIEIRSEDFGSFRKIAKIHVPRIGDRICEIDMMTAKANSDLIAAAPEMLEVLRKFMDFKDSDYVPNGIFERAKVVIERASAAL